MSSPVPKMKQKSINSFFGGKPAAAGEVTAKAAKAKPAGQAAAKENKQEGEKASKRPSPAQQAEAADAAAEGASRLKRLKRSAPSEPEQAADADMEDAMEDLEDDVAGSTPKPAAQQQAAEAAKPTAEAQAETASPQPKATGAAKANKAEPKHQAAKQLPEQREAAVKQEAKAQKEEPAEKTPVAKAAKPAKKASKATAAAPPKAKPAKAASKPAPPAAEAADTEPAGDEEAGPSTRPQRRQSKAAKASDGSSSGDEGDDAGGEEGIEGFSDDEEAGFTAPVAPIFKKGYKPAESIKQSTNKVDGVGAGALAAAVKYGAMDVPALITWKEGQPVPYLFLANTFEAIAGTTKRLEIVAMLVGAFRAILASTPADLLPAVYLCASSVAPAHEGLELGIGEATLFKTLAAATGRKESQLKKDYEESGDLGAVAAASRHNQRTMFPPPPLTIANVFKTFRDIAGSTGSNSQERKRTLITKLLVSSKECEPGYIMRSLQGKLRIGLQEQSILQALGHTVVLHSEGTMDKGPKLADALERAAQQVKQAYSECPAYDVLVPALTSHPLSELSEHVHFMPGVPVRPMLAKPTTGVQEVLDKFSGQEFTCEYKYDGERAQIHVLPGGEVLIYSRNAENNTPKYPDIVGRVKSWLKPGVDSLVIDAEAVAWDPQTSKILPFQVLSTRARKDVAVGDIKVHACVFAFDLLYLNGEAMLRKPMTERREALMNAMVEVPGELQFAVAKTSNDVEELQAFLDEAVAGCTEGLIVKTLHDTYEPSRRSSHWLKLKKDYLQGVGDTFDVVPIGAFYGRGKRAGVFGAYLVAVYDDDGEAFQTIAKVGTGFSEEQLKELADLLRPSVIPGPKPYYQYSDGLVPDVWFDAVAVWEVKAADLSISPVHKAAQGLVDSSKGISIRFPRLIRVRDDKKPEEATTAAQVVDMYRAQASVNKGQAAGDDD